MEKRNEKENFKKAKKQHNVGIWDVDINIQV